jgi:hypothetical protein
MLSQIANTGTRPWNVQDETASGGYGGYGGIDSSTSPLSDAASGGYGGSYDGDYRPIDGYGYGGYGGYGGGGYGGSATWQFNGVDSGVRLGEGTVTAVAVYATWFPGDPGTKLEPGEYWETNALYTISGTADGQTYTFHVNQNGSPGNDSPEPNDRPWKLLGVYDVNASDTLEVKLSWQYDSNGKIIGNVGGVLCVSDVMIHPLWPTVDIQQTGVTVPSQVSSLGKAAASGYVDWYDAWNPAGVSPEAGAGSRTEFALTATVDPLFAQAPEYDGQAWDWTAKMPPVLGASGQNAVEYWNDSQSATPWQQNQAIAPGAPWTGTVWVSAVPNSPPTDPFSVPFKACAPPGGGDAAAKAAVPGVPPPPTDIPAYSPVTVGRNAPFLVSSIVPPGTGGNGDSQLTVKVTETPAFQKDSTINFYQIVEGRPAAGGNSYAKYRDTDSAELAVQWTDSEGNCVGHYCNALWTIPATGGRPACQGERAEAAIWKSGTDAKGMQFVYQNLTVPPGAAYFTAVVVYTDVFYETPARFRESEGQEQGDMPDVIAFWVGHKSGGQWTFSAETYMCLCASPGEQRPSYSAAAINAVVDSTESAVQSAGYTLCPRPNDARYIAAVDAYMAAEATETTPDATLAALRLRVRDAITAAATASPPEINTGTDRGYHDTGFDIMPRPSWGGLPADPGYPDPLAG